MNKGIKEFLEEDLKPYLDIFFMFIVSIHRITQMYSNIMVLELWRTYFNKSRLYLKILE